MSRRSCRFCNASLASPPSGTHSVIPVCDLEACWIKYATNSVENNSHPEGDHVLWNHVITNRGVPTIRRRVGSEFTWRIIKAVDVLRLKAGEEITAKSTFPQCGEPMCVSPAHYKERVSLNRVYLPIQPLVRVVADHRRRFPLPAHSGGSSEVFDPYYENHEQEPHYPFPPHLKQAYKRGLATGRISVMAADAICCDYLEINPVAVWGLDFLTVGEEA